MTFLNKDQILKADDLKTVDIEVPEWTPEGASEPSVVRLRTLTSGERDKFESDSMIQKGANTRMNLVNMRARLIVLCAVDEGGHRIFRNEDVTALGAKSSLALDRLFNEARKLNGMSQEDVAELTEGFTEGQNEE